MKQIVLTAFVLATLLPQAVDAQLSNGGLFANFGIDADTRSYYLKYGMVTGTVPSDDWFAPGGSQYPYNVIDTSNWALYLAQLQSGANISFNERMSALLYAKMGGKLWIDAVYGKDYSAAASLKDPTVFVSANKNGDNPSIWLGGTSSVPNKNDIVDVYAHMRRDGLTVHDSLWLFTGLSTYGTSGAAYFDVELYKNNFAYNSTTGTFVTAGPDAGHTQWIFDAAGNIVQTGDLILAVNSFPGAVPTIDLRIWVSQNTMSTVTPVYFNFTGSYNGAAIGAPYGYASIVSKTGTTAWGGGLSNYSGVPANDTTYSTPWGTNAATGGSNWSPQYLSGQLVEIGLNLTRIGVDPALYAALSPCQPLFSDIFFKSRSSNSFISSLKDFVAPLTFTRTPVMDYSLQGDTLRCNHPVANITLTNNSTMGYYTWKTLSGNVSGSNSDSSQLSINKPGTYVVSASPAVGCPPTRTDTVVIPIDTFPPVAQVTASLSGSNLDLYGGNVSASNYLTPFGRSSGLTFSWSGPGAFTSTQQNPVTDTVWGAYNLTVTEKRNGCTATATDTLSRSMFIVLAVNQLVVSGVYTDPAINLHWQDPNQGAVQFYVVEKMDVSGNFQSLGTVFPAKETGASSETCLCYADSRPIDGTNFYRVKATTPDGQTYYSPIITVATGSMASRNIYLTGNSAGTLELIANSATDTRATIAIFTVTGQTLQKREVILSKGRNTIPLPANTGTQGKVQVISLFMNDRIAFSQVVPTL